MPKPEVDITDKKVKEPNPAPEKVLPDEIIESTAISSLASISEQPAMLSNMAYSDTITNGNLSEQNAVANQQSMNEVGVAVTDKQVNLLSTLGPLESKSSLEILTGNALAESIADLKAIIKGFSTPASGGGQAEPSPKIPDTLEGKPKIPDPLEGKIYAEVPVSFVFDVEEGHEIVTDVNEDSIEIDDKEQ